MNNISSHLLSGIAGFSIAFAIFYKIGKYWEGKNQYLKGCPHCGDSHYTIKEVRHSWAKPEGILRYAVECDHCRHRGPLGYSKQYAIAWWETRLPVMTENADTLCPHCGSVNLQMIPPHSGGRRGRSPARMRCLDCHAQGPHASSIDTAEKRFKERY